MSKAAVFKQFLFLLIVCIQSFAIVRCELKQLDTNTFDEFVKSNSHVLIVFKSAEECPHCTQTQKYVDGAVQPEEMTQEIKKGYTADQQLLAKYGIKDHSSIVYFRNGFPALYDKTVSSEDDLPEFVDWLEKSASVATKDLTDDNFEHLTQASTGATTGDWLVFFYKPSCPECLQVLPAIESVALRVSYRMNVARVDVETNKKLVDRFNIKQCPTTILFRQGKMYTFEPGLYTPTSLQSFVDGWFRNVKAIHVPTEPTAFDKLTESIALFIKDKMNNPNQKFPMIAAIMLVPALILVMIFCVCKKSDASNKSKLN